MAAFVALVEVFYRIESLFPTANFDSELFHAATPLLS